MALTWCACGQTQTEREAPATSPAGYDLTSPVIYKMPADLFEISGIGFYQGDPETIFAEQDEKGNLYWLKPGDTKASHLKFGKAGDYEDLALANDQAFLLRSDGTLYSFPFKPAGPGAAAQNTDAETKEWKGLLPKGEYEGMYADGATRRLYVLCKNCAADRGSGRVSGYILAATGDGADLQLAPAGGFSIDAGQITARMVSQPAATEEAKSRKHKKKGKGKESGPKALVFKPSALTWNARTSQWYMLSSVNKMLVVTDEKWQVQQVHSLKSTLFPQPEGITFDSAHNLYISNEGAGTPSGTILKFPFRP